MKYSVTTAITAHSRHSSAGAPGQSRSTPIRPHDATMVSTPESRLRSRLLAASQSETPSTTA